MSLDTCGRSTWEQICCNGAIGPYTSQLCCKVWPFPSCTRAQLIRCWHFSLFSCVTGSSAAPAELSPLFGEGEAAACRLALRFIKAQSGTICRPNYQSEAEFSHQRRVYWWATDVERSEEVILLVLIPSEAEWYHRFITKFLLPLIQSVSSSISQDWNFCFFIHLQIKYIFFV